jgi:hypothetical protein
MNRAPDCDLSLIIPFSDDEETVGAMSRRAAAHLSALGVRFEILAVDEDSGDNSVALLGLLREGLPQLQLLPAAPRAGFAAGARVARGRTLWMWDPTRASSPLAALGWACRRLDGGDDVAVVPGRFLVCRRTTAWRTALRVHGRGQLYETRLVAEARRRRLSVAAPPGPPPPPPLLRRLFSLPALRRQRA